MEAPQKIVLPPLEIPVVIRSILSNGVNVISGCALGSAPCRPGGEFGLHSLLLIPD